MRLGLMFCRLKLAELHTAKRKKKKAKERRKSHIVDEMRQLRKLTQASKKVKTLGICLSNTKMI